MGFFSMDTLIRDRKKRTVDSQEGMIMEKSLCRP
jgi:hypothetical protein